MAAGPRRYIDGFMVRGEAVMLDKGVLAIEIVVSREDGGLEARWSLPRFVTFPDMASALRHAELVLAGILSIDPAIGEPRYGIL